MPDTQGGQGLRLSSRGNVTLDIDVREGNRRYRTFRISQCEAGSGRLFRQHFHKCED